MDIIEILILTANLNRQCFDRTMKKDSFLLETMLSYWKTVICNSDFDLPNAYPNI